MLLPAAFGSIEDSYHHLKKNVQVWDVAGERQVEITGNDAAKLVQLMTCRDLSKSKDGRCYYCPIIDDKGGLINDPVVLRLNNNLAQETNQSQYQNTSPTATQFFVSSSLSTSTAGFTAILFKSISAYFLLNQETLTWIEDIVYCILHIFMIRDAT